MLQIFSVPGKQIACSLLSPCYSRTVVVNFNFFQLKEWTAKVLFVQSSLAKPLTLLNNIQRQLEEDSPAK